MRRVYIKWERKNGDARTEINTPDTRELKWKQKYFATKLEHFEIFQIFSKTQPWFCYRHMASISCHFCVASCVACVSCHRPPLSPTPAELAKICAQQTETLLQDEKSCNPYTLQRENLFMGLRFLPRAVLRCRTRPNCSYLACMHEWICFNIRLADRWGYSIVALLSTSSSNLAKKRYVQLGAIDSI